MNREAERKRLVELIKQVVHPYFAEELADHLLDNGIVVPPVKVGQMMYVISKYYGGEWKIFECKVNDITIFENNIFIALHAVNNFCFGENISQIGKTVFLTREQALKALERSED